MIWLRNYSRYYYLWVLFTIEAVIHQGEMIEPRNFKDEFEYIFNKIKKLDLWLINKNRIIIYTYFCRKKENEWVDVMCKLNIVEDILILVSFDEHECVHCMLSCSIVKLSCVSHLCWHSNLDVKRGLKNMFWLVLVSNPGPHVQIHPKIAR